MSSSQRNKVKNIFMFLFFSFSINSFADSKRDVWQKPELVLKTLLSDSKDATFCEIGSGNGYFTLKAANYVKKVIAT